MKYSGKFDFFDFTRLNSYPISERQNKVTSSDILAPEKILNDKSIEVDEKLQQAAEITINHFQNNLPVMFMIGAHPVKLGMNLLLSDLINRGIVSHIAGNGATSIHDFELAMISSTSENVPDSLSNGKFGMAHETGHYMNTALQWGNSRFLGYGESIAKLINSEIRLTEKLSIKSPELSLIAAAYNKNIPVTIHATIGTDIIDQHSNADFESKGGCTGRDFAIFASTISKMINGGVVINLGSAVTLPEVLLKAVSMAANIGHPPKGITTFNFDIRPLDKSAVNNENKSGYYFRDQKSVACRIPEAFGGKGFYIEGNFKKTIPAFYKALIMKFEG
ncbi:MAG: GSU2086 family protein [Planctomycetota bacterium]